MKIKRIHHVAIAVDDIDTAINFWKNTLGLELSRTEEVSEQEVVVAFLPCGDSQIELVQPLQADSSIAQFIQKHGQGIHHICLEVEDIQSAIEEMRSQGVLLINKKPLLMEDGRKYAFIHPRSTGGALVELYQLP